MSRSAGTNVLRRHPVRLLAVLAVVLAGLGLGPTQRAFPAEPVVLEFQTELVSLSLSGGPFLMPLASDPTNALGDSISGYGLVKSSVSVTLSSQRPVTPGPASSGTACAYLTGGPTAAAAAVTSSCRGIPGEPPPIVPAELDGQQFFVDSFFDVFFDITVTDVDPRPFRDFPGMPDGATILLPDNGPAQLKSAYNRVFDMDAHNFGLIPPPVVSPYIGHFNIEIPLGGDINGNGESDKIKFTLATHAVGDRNRTFVTLPDGTVIDSFDSAAYLAGAVVDASADPPFEIGAIDPGTGLPDPAVFGGPTTASSLLLNPLAPGLPRPQKQDVLDRLIALRAGATRPHDQHKLDDAIKHLAKSLAPALWVDDGHVVAKHGEKVFNEERAAVGKLLELIKDRKSELDGDLLRALAEDLAGADRGLASIAIDDATAASGDPKKLARAADELAKGDADTARGRLGEAIEHYRNAWEKAQQAV